MRSAAPGTAVQYNRVMDSPSDRSGPPSLATRLSSLSREQLQSLIERLASDSEAFAARIDYLTRPDSATEGIALRIAAIRRDDRFVGYESLGDAAHVVRGIQEDIQRDVLRLDPVGALALTEQLMALDQALMNRSLDDGTIGAALSEACTLWLKVARVVRESNALPKMDWVARLYELARDDDYGVRMHILEEAHLLFDEPELRGLAEHLESKAIEARHGGRRLASTLPNRVPLYEAVPTRGMQDLAKALRDPELYDRATRLGHPSVGTHQLEDMARFHLDCGNVAGALRILEQPWEDDREISRLNMLDRAYGQLGDAALRIDVRRKRYQQLPCLWTYQALEELLDEMQRQELRAQVAAEAFGFRDVGTAAQLLCAADSWPLAQVILLTRAQELEGSGATQLEPLAKEAEDRGYPLISVIIWRALLNPILDGGRSRAYHHGAQYLNELRRLAGKVDDYRELPAHAEYEDGLRARHGRKTGFWRQMLIR